jgi:hypothetical protein
MARYFLLVCLTFFLGSCQPPPVKIVAMMEAGKVVFYLRQGGLFSERIFDKDDKDAPFGAQGLRVWSGNEIYWQIAVAEEGAASASFPVIYGELPSKTRPVIAAKPLVKGKKYHLAILRKNDDPLVQAAGWPDESGYFLLTNDGRIDNLQDDWQALDQDAKNSSKAGTS